MNGKRSRCTDWRRQFVRIERMHGIYVSVLATDQAGKPGHADIGVTFLSTGRDRLAIDARGGRRDVTSNPMPEAAARRGILVMEGHGKALRTRRRARRIQCGTPILSGAPELVPVIRGLNCLAFGNIRTSECKVAREIIARCESPKRPPPRLPPSISW
jgi:hypothetical protein